MAVAISQFFVLSNRGDTLILRDFRGDVVRGTAEIFFRRVMASKDVAPVFNLDGINFGYIKKNNLFFVCTTQFNASPMFIVQALNRLASVFKDYCGQLNEEAIRNNFVLVYELLDEMLDFGYLQDTTTEQLRAFVCTKAVDTLPPPDAVSKLKGLGKGKTNSMASTSTQKPIDTGLSGRTQGRNEIFVDLLERITVVFSSSGQVLRSQIDGSLQMKSYLHGNPELKIGLNEEIVIGRGAGAAIGAIVLDDVSFHECVDVDEFESARVMSFQPPDGEFVAMNYRLSGEFRTPFRVFPFVEAVDETRFDVIVKVRADFPDINHANNVVVRVPLPKFTQSVSTDVFGAGIAEYQAKEKVAFWAVKKFHGGSEHTLRLRVALPSGTDNWRKEVGPIAMDFELPMFNCSGVTIRFLKLFEREGYNPYRWVRYITTSDSYVIRV